MTPLTEKLREIPKGDSVELLPCMNCGGSPVLVQATENGAEHLSGGVCTKCQSVSLRPAPQNPLDLTPYQTAAANWNESNDVKALIAGLRKIISNSEREIDRLMTLPGSLTPLKPEEVPLLMTKEEFEKDDPPLYSDDGTGYWATATHWGRVSTDRDAPPWATHVLWFGR